MSLILAIEPDRRQVAHLISIVRHVLGAELIVADTTEGALESIGNSVPDLILVPALLSPQDDAALAAALRVIATAAHVQMLTIPTFAAPKPQPKKGMLSAFRRKPVDDAPIEGCDPKVFAEEIASYIERANEERAAAQFYEDEPDAVQPEPLQVEAPANEAVETVEKEPAYALVEEDAQPEPVTVFEANEPAIEPIVEAMEPIVEEVYAAPEVAIDAIEAIPEPELVAEPLPVEEPEAPEMPMAAAPADPAMALDEFVATLEQTTPVAEEEPAAVEVEDVMPVAAAAPVFEDLLADFDGANLQVIDDVQADPWMAETVEAKSDALEDEADLLDIDLSIELDTVVEAEEPALAAAPEPAQALKPFEPVVPVERFEPFPLAAWQAWPRLDWTPPEKPAVLDAHAGNGNGNGNGHHKPDTSDASIVADVDRVAEFEPVLEAEASLATFEPVMPVERFEPMPLAAWQAWPRLEGVAAEAYQEPIAPRKAAAKPEWVELMRSLREDIARRRSELAASGPVAPPAQKPQRPRAAETRVQAAKPAPAPSPAPAPAAVPADPKKPRPKRTRPIEDEWGLFDPEQCGFAALLDKLDEMTVAPPPNPRRPER